MRPCKSDQPSDKLQESFFPTAAIVVMAGILQASCASVPERFTPAYPLDPAQLAHPDLEAALQSAVHDGVVDYPALQDDPRFSGYLAPTPVSFVARRRTTWRLPNRWC